MQLGIHVNTFPRPTLEATLDAVGEHGLACVHLNLKAAGVVSMPERVDDALCERIGRGLRARAITVGSLAGTFNMIHPDAALRREGLERLEVVASAARRLGTSVVTLCTGTRHPTSMWRTHPDNGTPEAWRDLVESMACAVEIAERHDVTLAIEPEVSNVVDSAVKARRLLDEIGSDRLKIIMDGANLFHTGELPRMREILDAAFELLGPDVVLAHAKDLDRDGEAGQVAAGRGLLDYDYYLALLGKIGFTGPLILHSLEESDVPGCVAMLREKLGKKG
jgi:sugar phosphate isomerase/epimerase